MINLISVCHHHWLCHCWTALVVVAAIFVVQFLLLQQQQKNIFYLVTMVLILGLTEFGGAANVATAADDPMDNNNLPLMMMMMPGNGGLQTAAAAAAVAAGPIGIVPFGNAGRRLDPFLAANFGPNNGAVADGDGTISAGGGGGGDAFQMSAAYNANRQQQHLAAAGAEHTPFPTLIPADQMRQLVMMAIATSTAPTLSAAAAGNGLVETDGTGDGIERLALFGGSRDGGGGVEEREEAMVPLGEVRDVSMGRSLPVFGYGENAAAAGRYGTMTGGGEFGIADPMAYGTTGGGGDGGEAAGSEAPITGVGNCFWSAIGGECIPKQFGAIVGNTDNNNNVAQPVPMMGGGIGAAGSYVGNDGAYEYPMVEEAEEAAAPFGQQQQKWQGGGQDGGTIYEQGFMRGNAEMGGSVPLSAPYSFGGSNSFGSNSLSQFWRGGEAASSAFGTAVAGGGTMDYGGSAEEWDNGMTGGGGRGGRGGGRPIVGGQEGWQNGGATMVPSFWMGNAMMGGQPSTDAKGISESGNSRTMTMDSEERQQYSQYLESIQRHYGVVPSRHNNLRQLLLGANIDQPVQLINEPTESPQPSSPLSQQLPSSSAGIFLPRAISDGTAMMPYGHRFGMVGTMLAPQTGAAGTSSTAPVPSSSFFGTSFAHSLASSPSSLSPCAAVAGDQQQSFLSIFGTKGGGLAGPARPSSLTNVNGGGQQIHKQQTLQQRKTVPMPNFNGDGAIISDSEGGGGVGPFSTVGIRSPCHPPSDAVGTDQQQHQQQSRQNWMNEADGIGGERMPMLTKMPPTQPAPLAAQIVIGTGNEQQQQLLNGQIVDDNDDDLRQQLLEQSLLLSLLTSQQQTTMPTRISSSSSSRMPMSTQQVPTTRMTTTAQPVWVVPPVTTTTTTTTPITTTTTATTMTMTTTEEKTPPIQQSTTSVQALSQQIRRLPVVLYADSRKADSRRLEVLLRDAYGLPLVTFYADKIGRRPELVEANLAKLTAHRGMPYLFICGTFIGSLEHIQNYHEQQQIPRLVKHVCSGEAEAEKGVGGKTAANAETAQNNRGSDDTNRGSGTNGSKSRRRKAVVVVVRWAGNSRGRWVLLFESSTAAQGTTMGVGEEEREREEQGGRNKSRDKGRKWGEPWEKKGVRRKERGRASKMMTTVAPPSNDEEPNNR